jgi:hypothetical protein
MSEGDRARTRDGEERKLAANTSAENLTIIGFLS